MGQIIHIVHGKMLGVYPKSQRDDRRGLLSDGDLTSCMENKEVGGGCGENSRGPITAQRTNDDWDGKSTGEMQM